MSKARELANLGNAYSDGALSNRNLIINGAMQVAQRGTSFTNPASSSYTLDRWYTLNSSDGAVDVSQSTEAPTGFKNSLKIDVTTADSSMSAAQYYTLGQAIEGQNLTHLSYGSADAKEVTISFWVRSNKTGTYHVEIQTSGSQELARPYTINTANTWEHKTLTWIANTDYTISENNGTGLYVYWWLAAGSNYTGSPIGTTWVSNTNRVTGQTNFLDSASNDFYLTGVQLEIGDSSTPFEHRSYADQLQACQRYYQKLGGANYTRFFSGFCGTTTAANCVYVFSCEMRAAPTAGSSGTFAVYHSSNTISTTSSLGVSSQTATSMAVSGNTSGLTVGRGALIIANNDSSAKFTLDAEL